ncbi:adenylate/guanylate cyclase domain-containing protein [Geitlerinema sp. CS-897]|nr:adenylate/guanylate cyclase domain-containing protein [Geitlerinema sp. CS-897]
MPIGIKIFSIAASMLGLLLVVVYVSSERLRRVNEEIDSLVEYTIPITDAVARLDVRALEQEVLLERIFKHYTREPIDRAQIAEEIAEFDRRTLEIEEALSGAATRAERTIALANAHNERQELTTVVSMLEAAGREYRNFHDRAVRVLSLLQDGALTEAQQLQQDLVEDEANLDRSLEAILLEMESFTVASARSAQQHQETVQQLSLTIALLATLLGGMGAWLVTLGLVHPIRQLIRQMRAIQHGDFNVRATVSSRDEVAILADAFDRMVGELQSKLELEETFGRYVDSRAIEQLLASAEDPKTTGDCQIVTVSFADVEGFSEINETRSPDALVATIDQYLTLMSQPIGQQSGVIDKFIHTTVMGFWSPPFCDTSDRARLACNAALAQRKQLPQIERLLRSHLPDDTPLSDLHLRVGIASGSLVVGNMGSATAKKSYTVMGDTVNIAARLKGVSKQYGVEIALDDSTEMLLGDRYATRELDWIKVVGKEEPVRVYELLGWQDELDDETRQRQDEFARGLAAYRHRQWDTAQKHFSACSMGDRPDPPALLYLNRIETLRDRPLPENWDGVWQLTSK